MNISKDLIHRHPLFPLLVTIFDKCEIATNNSSVGHSGLASIHDDVNEFIRKLSPGQLQSYTGHGDLDDLMIQGIQVLRFHLLELEKVQELCEDFCQKYIGLLKGKMPTDLIVDETKSEDESLFSNEEPLATEYLPTPQSPSEQMSDCESCEEDEDDSRDRRKKRGILPKAATSLMRAWLFEHLHHPYPTEEQKKLLAKETNLNILQVNNWFINARRRIVQPMIDQSNQPANFEMMMGTGYNDLLTNHPYATWNPSLTPYGFPSHNEISAGMSTSIYSHQFFAPMSR